MQSLQSTLQKEESKNQSLQVQTQQLAMKVEILQKHNEELMRDLDQSCHIIN